MSPHYLVNCTTFFTGLKVCCIPPNVGGSEKSRLWVGIGGDREEPVVICGKWNVRQATLQQMFKVTTFCTDTCFQSFSPMINCIIHHAVLKFIPCRNASATRLYRGLMVLDTREKIKKDEKFVHFTRQCGNIFRCGG